MYFVLKGNLCYSEAPERLATLSGGYAVCVGGKCRGAFETLPAQYADLPLVDAGDATFVQASSVIVAQLAEVGIQVDVRTVDFASLWTYVGNHEFDLYSVQYTLVPADPLMDISWLVSGGENYVGYVNDAVDQTLASVGSLKTNDELKAAYSLVNQAMQQDVPMINVYVSEPLGAVSNRLLNAEPHAYGSFNHVEAWDIAQ